MTGILSSLTLQNIVSIAILIWGLAWEMFALWKAARKRHRTWFFLIFIAWLFGNFNFVLSIIGPFGALPILYIFIFSRFRFENDKLVFDKWVIKRRKKKS